MLIPLETSTLLTMIYEAFAILRSQLEQYIRQNSTISSTDDEVVLGNISLAESGNSSDITNKVVMSLVKLEEDATLKNGQTRFKEANRIRKENRPVHSYAYILFTAHYPSSYSNALKRLTSVVKFFQGKSTFTKANSPLTEVEDADGINELKMSLELISPSFEQLNHIWGMMGGKSHPSVLYKARILEIKRDAPQDYDTPITHILINE